jgi:hypothetical protein
MQIDKNVNLLGVSVAMPAAVVVIVAAVMVIFLAVSALRSNSGIRQLTAILMLLIYVALPAALFAYTVHCLVSGKCSVWALILTVVFVLYAGIAMANYRSMAAILQNALRGKWSLIGYRIQKAGAAVGRRRV